MWLRKDKLWVCGKLFNWQHKISLYIDAAVKMLWTGLKNSGKEGMQRRKYLNQKVNQTTKVEFKKALILLMCFVIKRGEKTKALFM